MRPVSWVTAPVLVATVLAVAGCTAPEPPRLALLDRAATADDALPDEVELDDGYDSLRYVGETDGALVYAARTPGDDPWCVLVIRPGDDWVAGSACADDTQFRERGVRVGVSGPDGARADATLLPDDFAGTLDEEEWRVVGPNLAVPAE